jgi:hypothetical protein
VESTPGSTPPRSSGTSDSLFQRALSLLELAHQLAIRADDPGLRVALSLGEAITLAGAGMGRMEADPGLSSSPSAASRI